MSDALTQIEGEYCRTLEALSRIEERYLAVGGTAAMLAILRGFEPDTTDAPDHWGRGHLRL